MAVGSSPAIRLRMQTAPFCAQASLTFRITHPLRCRQRTDGHGPKYDTACHLQSKEEAPAQDSGLPAQQPAPRKRKATASPPRLDVEEPEPMSTDSQRRDAQKAGRSSSSGSKRARKDAEAGAAGAVGTAGAAGTAVAAGAASAQSSQSAMSKYSNCSGASLPDDSRPGISDRTGSTPKSGTASAASGDASPAYVGVQCSRQLPLITASASAPSPLQQRCNERSQPERTLQRPLSLDPPAAAVSATLEKCANFSAPRLRRRMLSAAAHRNYSSRSATGPGAIARTATRKGQVLQLRQRCASMAAERAAEQSFLEEAGVRIAQLQVAAANASTAAASLAERVVRLQVEAAANRAAAAAAEANLARVQAEASRSE